MQCAHKKRQQFFGNGRQRFFGALKKLLARLLSVYVFVGFENTRNWRHQFFGALKKLLGVFPFWFGKRPAHLNIRNSANWSSFMLFVCSVIS